MAIKGSLINSIGTKTASTDDATELTKSVRPHIASIITQHPSVLHGLGNMKAEPIQLHVKPNASPVIQLPRPIPYHLKDTFDDAIRKMESDDGIKPQIYKNFGNNKCHKCNNEPPFNGQEFHDWSIKQAIRIKLSYPYHSQ